MIINFCAIDFETMTSVNTSACAIGMVEVKNGVIMRKFFSLIKPVPDDKEKTNTFVHGITPEMCEDAPTWDEIFPILKEFTSSHVIACHNSSTDIYILKSLNEFYDLKFGYKNEVIDTMDFNGKSLEDCCKKYEIKMECHHDALSDATACAELELAYNGIKVEHHEFRKPYKKPSFDTLEKKKVNKQKLAPLSADEVENKDTPFFQKNVVLTGILLAFPEREVIAEKLRNLGAYVKTSISKKTDIIIVGIGAGPAKMEKVEELQKDGINITVYDEVDLMQILKSIEK
jgi:DNA polymerase-3 subunit epsilon